MAAHDFANPLDVRRAVAGEHFRYVLEIARAKQTWADDGEHARVNVALVSESVDHAAGYEERLPGTSHSNTLTLPSDSSAST